MDAASGLEEETSSVASSLGVWAVPAAGQRRRRWRGLESAATGSRGGHEVNGVKAAAKSEAAA
jgi:hypothetical protein